MAALDLFGRRWTLRLIWELSGGALGARELLRRCDEMSSSVLYDRLKELTEAGLLRKNDAGHYELSEIGSELVVAIQPLIRWSSDWEAARSAP